MNFDSEGMRELGSGVDPISIELPALEITDEDMRLAEESLQESDARFNADLFIRTVAERLVRERQLKSTLLALEVTKADLDDSAIIIGRHEALSGLSQKDWLMEDEADRIKASVPPLA